MTRRAPSSPARRPSLEERLAQALQERDAALAALAQERAVVNALRLASARRGEPEPKDYPVAAGPGEAPLRYVLADEANDTLKAFLGPLHRGVKGVLKGRAKKR